MASKYEDVKSLPVAELRKRLDHQRRLLQNRYGMVNNCTFDFSTVYRCSIVIAIPNGAATSHIVSFPDPVIYCGTHSCQLDSRSVRTVASESALHVA